MLFSRQKAADAKKISEMQALIDALHKVQAVISFDPKGNILDANENFLGAMGYALEDIVGKHHRIFVESDYVKSPEYTAFWDELGKGKYLAGEFTRISKTGEAVYIEASYNPIFNEDGEVVKVVKFAIDVTKNKLKTTDASGQLDAISRSQAVIEFDLAGNILSANDNFLNVMGYTLQEARGQHHRIFVDPVYAKSDEYAAFWRDLADGKFVSAEFQRVSKNGDLIWIQATYNPILDPKGRPYKVVKFATDVTAEKMQSADNTGKLTAISRAQAVIEFELDGTVINANQNFLDVTGYRLDDVKGKHDQMFVEPDEGKSPEYTQFWKDLAAGEFRAGEFKRIAKDGSVRWLQATYNPILDQDGKPLKVIKYATDATAWKAELQNIINSLIALSKGDLTQRLADKGSPDFAEMRAAFNGTLDKLSEMVGDINFESTSIQEESEAIADSATDLSTRCERQAATVEETSAAMEEMSSTVKSNAQNAKDATAAAKNATQHAEQGGTVVNDAIAAMGKIEAGSAKVRKIIEVIDAIAFQTNLLALNAGVEAARAGEAGSGFAVVASEVRALAQRASESARDISELIETSEKQVAEGAALVKATGTALSEIVSSVTQVSAGIDGIFTASSEQATGVNEINQAMSEIDSTTQKTAAISEESTAAAASLAQRATALRELVSFFQMNGRGQSGSGQGPRKDKLAASQAPKPVKSTQTAMISTAQLAHDTTSGDDDWKEF
ncbi:methyl-accepting chemotaxis protein [Rhodobacteraceae bacterium]|nr:methyl-accepting chemotaxis protein [Paracoccaceae bacterium]